MYTSWPIALITIRTSVSSWIPNSPFDVEDRFGTGKQSLCWFSTLHGLAAPLWRFAWKDLCGCSVRIIRDETRIALCAATLTCPSKNVLLCFMSALLKMAKQINHPLLQGLIWTRPLGSPRNSSALSDCSRGLWGQQEVDLRVTVTQ